MTIANSGLAVLQSAHPTNFKVKRMPDWKAWTVAEAAERSGYNAEYIRRLCRQDKIEHSHIGRVLLIKAESLIRYVDDMKNKDDNRYGPQER